MSLRVRMGVAAGLTLAGAGLTVATAKLGFGLIGLATAQVILAAAAGVFFSVVVKRYIPWYGFSRPSFAQPSSTKSPVRGSVV